MPARLREELPAASMWPLSAGLDDASQLAYAGKQVKAMNVPDDMPTARPDDGRCSVVPVYSFSYAWYFWFNGRRCRWA
ncbi:MAG: hypothetical protein AMXMBFR13_38070 [Phycisphaerae bacterium]